MDVELHSLLMSLDTVLWQVEQFDPNDSREVKAIKKKASQRREQVKAYILRAASGKDEGGA